MDHSGMDHSSMDHSGMDHSMHHAGMDHSGMDHGEMGEMPVMCDHDMGMDMNGTDHMMKMYFHFGVSETILFKGWETDNVGGLIGSMIGIFVLATLYEGLKYWREDLMRKAIAKQQYVANASKANCAEENKQIQVNMMSFPHAIQTLLHMVQMIISYFLMLIFMTYNVWLCIAVVLGAGLGYFLFGWRKATVVDITEHCH